MKVNLLLREFADRVSERRRRRRTWARALAPAKRALYVSSPIGLGHAWRDVAIADELRRQVPGLEIEWLAQEPVTTVLRAPRGDDPSRPAPSSPARRRTSIARRASTTCTRFRPFAGWTRSVRQLHGVRRPRARGAVRRLDRRRGWELDHFLHENPELKTAPYAWLTDFVGFLPMPAGGDHEAFLTADYNAEMIEQIERFPSVRDRAIFVGEPGDIVPDDVRAWAAGDPRVDRAHYRFSGYIPGFDPAVAADGPSSGGAGIRRRSAVRRLGGWLRSRRGAAAARDRGCSACPRADAEPADAGRCGAAYRSGDAAAR